MAWYNFFMSNMSIWAQVLDRTGFSWVFKSFDQYPTDTDPEYRIETVYLLWIHLLLPHSQYMSFIQTAGKQIFSYFFIMFWQSTKYII